jgi:predicted phage-related endonuclease
MDYTHYLQDKTNEHKKMMKRHAEKDSAGASLSRLLVGHSVVLQDTLNSAMS